MRAKFELRLEREPTLQFDSHRLRMAFWATLRISQKSSCKGTLASLSSAVKKMDSAMIRPGLERILPLLTRLDSPQRAFPVIHIAGTNSKGTTSSILDSTLQVLGFHTARFNSPHLKEQRDSCLIGGQVVSPEVWQAAGDKVSQADELSSAEFDLQPIEASPFELVFARFLVCATLSNPRPRVLIVECGMGGAQDATNVFPSANVLASVITPIGSDHKAFLGDTLAEITEHKMGIAKDHGLVVVADQRGPDGFAKRRAMAPSTKAHLAQWQPEDESKDLVGDDASQVLSTIRRVGETLRARLVKCETPFDAVQSSSSGSSGNAVDPQRPWECTSQWSVILPPILTSTAATASHDHDAETGVSIQDDDSASKTPASSSSLASTLFTNSSYSSAPGQNPLTTPKLPPLPPTFPVLSSVSTALSTLYAIACDEPPSARLQTGGDAHEELRLTLAYGLQAAGLVGRAQERGVLSDEIEAAIVQGVRNWQGRGSWVDIKPDLHAFLDGAHNPPALKALFAHLRTILQQHHSEQQPLTITILCALSSSKEKDGDLDAILDILATAPQALASVTDAMQAMSLSTEGQQTSSPLSVRLGFLPFTTPVEGMPWVQPLSPQLLKDRLPKHASLQAVEVFDSLPHALDWASKGDDGSQLNGRPSSSSSSSSSSMLVIAGSLYLIADVYRML